MEFHTDISGRTLNLHPHENAARNERFVGECLKKIKTATDAEDGLRQLLCFLGERLECERVYVFEEMDRQHASNTYEWCARGVPSGIRQLPYVAKKDLQPWYGIMMDGGNIIVPDVEPLRQSDPLIYDFLKPQGIRSIILSPLLDRGKLVGFLGADNPPPKKMEHISVVFDVLAYFVSSLVSQRELAKLREARVIQPGSNNCQPRYPGRTVMLVDDSPELLRLNERVLRPDGYRILSARTLQEAGALLEKNTPDTIVLDIDLPDGNGLDFCRELQERKNIPIIFLTARSDAQTDREGMKAGGFAFLTKPYQLEDLQDAVSNAVEAGNQRKEGRDESGKEMPHTVVRPGQPDRVI